MPCYEAYDDLRCQITEDGILAEQSRDAGPIFRYHHSLQQYIRHYNNYIAEVNAYNLHSNSISTGKVPGIPERELPNWRANLTKIPSTMVATIEAEKSYLMFNQRIKL